MSRRTKIIATLGPASNAPEQVKELILAGANVFRLNFSHGTWDEQTQRAEMVRSIAAECGQHVALMADLQGPKIRIQGFAKDAIELQEADKFTLDTELDAKAGDQNQVGVLYKALPDDCKVGDRLLLDDGRIELDITEISGSRINTVVATGGRLSNNKGINLAGGGLSAPALTEKDLADLECVAKLNIDYLAISFPKSAEDIEYARSEAKKAGYHGHLVAKMERSESVATQEAMDSIIRASDAIMVARGDLGVEIGDAQLLGIQKRLILRARQLNKIVITATQMMESMIDSPLPTRAEVFDVANAVLDGTDAVMLSAETAVGAHPAKVVEAMDRVIRGAEKERITQQSQHRLDRKFDSTHETIAMTAMYAANQMENMRAIVCHTESGTTPLLMSRIRSGIPIYALSSNPETLRRMAMVRGVTAVRFDQEYNSVAENIKASMAKLKEDGILTEGDQIILSIGDSIGKSGHTNTLKVLIAE
ncbi:MAG: pyruvate kinase [Porticoccaceae bacterium]|nr:pyruvate kinase [Porticoccaceae bacterium]